jgi:glucose/arabinose dehydrogenase
MRRLLCLLPFLAGPAVAGDSGAGAPDFIRLPPGFRAEILTADVPNARSMALAPDGTLYVATRQAGSVYAVAGALSGRPRVSTLLTGLRMPNGIALRDGNLYVGEQHRISMVRGVERNAAPALQVIVPDLPYKNPLHSWRYMAFGPDGKLYVSIGAPCNVCTEPEFATILRFGADGSGREVFARGVRNSVGFDWHPRTGEFWFTDNGRDMLGDTMPPCELNRASKVGLDYGFPYCHGASVADPEYGKTGDCKAAVAPAQELGPHVAPLGVRFYGGRMFPKAYRGQLLIAEHGSWNRSKAGGRTGYRISLVRLRGNTPVAYETFADGFEAAGDVRGRPVDLLVAPDGSLLVSDDHRGVVYRISYSKKS